MSHGTPRRKGIRRKLIVGGAALLFLFAATCAFFRVSRPRDLLAYWGMSTECHPVWKEFALRRLSFGDPADAMVKNYPPSYVEAFGNYAVYSYDLAGEDGIAFTSLSVVARDGKLFSAAAGSCMWDFTFFETKDHELDRQYELFAANRRRELERREETR